MRVSLGTARSGPGRGGAVVFSQFIVGPVGPRTITTQELTSTKTGGNDWITYGGALNNQRYSSLNQINTSNVAELRGTWINDLGSGAAQSTASRLTRWSSTG